jgi:hypothetical protein
MMLAIAGLLAAAVLALVVVPLTKMHAAPGGTRKVTITAEQVDDFLQTNFCLTCGARRHALQSQCACCGANESDWRQER